MPDDLELYPVGFSLGARPGTPTGVLHVRRGWDEIVLDEPLLATVWLLLAGAPQLDLNAAWGRQSLVRAFRRVEAEQLAGGPPYDPIDPSVVTAAIDRLLDMGLAVEVDPWTADAVQVAKQLRLCPLQTALGADPRGGPLYRVGFADGPEVRIHERSFAFWKIADDVRSLLEMAFFFTQDETFDGRDPDINWRSTRHQLPFVYDDIRPLLWYGLAALDVVAAPGPPIPEPSV